MNVDFDTLTVAVTGDIAYSGKTEEYTAATEYFRYLREGLQGKVASSVHIVVCPGNHDCDFPDDAAVRDLVIKDIRERGVLPESGSMMAECTVVQTAFFEWLRQMELSPGGTEPCLSWTVVITCGDGVRIAFRCLNTAWMSTLREEQGRLFFPTSSVPDIAHADVRVTLMHHPYPWFQSGNARELRRGLEDTSDLVLSGHEHDYDEFAKVKSTDEPTGYVEGGLLNSEDKKHCAFSVVQIDAAGSCYAVTPFSWCSDHFVAMTAETQWRPYVCATNAAAHQQRLSDETKAFLDDLGLQLTHRAKELTLEDIFVPPDLRTYEHSDKPTALGTAVVPSRLTINTLLDDRHVYVLGEGQSGKTTLAKMLFRHAIRRGLTPVFVNGSDLRKADGQQAAKIIGAAVDRHYMHLTSEEFWQTPVESRVLFVDDFGDSPLNSTGKAKLITWLKGKFGHTCLFAGDLTQVEELVAAPEEDTALQGYRRYEIRPFGHLLRDILIEKWITLGQEHLLQPIELQHQIRETAHTVSQTLGQNLLPANPVYILILLQQLEAQVPLDTRSGSYGYFYETVLTLALQQSSRSAEEVDAKYTFLSELAWHLHTQGRYDIDEEGLDHFTREHIDKFGLNCEPSRLKEGILDSRLLPMRYGKYRFVYRYFFYYFVARHMRDNFDERDVQKCVDEAARQIHREDFANILIFLTYLTKSRPVIQRVIDEAKSLFRGVSPSDLADHVAFISRVQDSLPAIVLPDGDPKKQRRAVLEKVDADDRQRVQTDGDEPSQDERDREDAELNEVLLINRAIKALQVLGQILRNFTGSLKSDIKLEITQECFDLALRVFNSFCTLMERHLDTTLEALADLFGKKFEDLPERQRVPAAKEFVFFVTEIMCLATFRRISYAVGSETLVKTYEALEGSYDTRATRFVQLCLRLDHSRAFPEKRIDELRKEVEDDVFGLTLLRMLVAEHFYLFDRPYKVRQSVCRKLGISYQRTLGHSKAALPGVPGEK